MTPAGARGGQGSCIVEASAGTGKTRELVNRIVAAVLDGCGVERIVAVTFTIAAAGEMKLRLRQELDRTRQDLSIGAQARDRAGEALQHLERAFIGTIHAFCAQLLRQRPVEARVDPAFQELAQPEAYALFGREFRSWIEARMMAPPRAFERLFARWQWRDGDPIEALQSAAWQLTEWRDFPSPWERRPAVSQGELERLMTEVAEVVQLREHCDRKDRDPLYASLQPVSECLDRYSRAGEIGARDYDAVESDVIRLPELLRWLRVGGGPYARGVSRDAVKTAWEGLKLAIQQFREKADAELAAELREELWPLTDRYQQAKARLGALDFNDLLIRARALLGNEEARRYFQNRYQRIFVDEFQDTDPLQAEILMLLAADNPSETDWEKSVPGRLFLVGDPKQSIYRFRRADVALYRKICSRLEGAGVASETLSASRRSVAPLQEFVNAAFQEMEGYIPLTEGREPTPDQPAVIALPMPRPYGYKGITQKAILECSPGAVAAFIEWLLERKWRVSDPKDPARLKEIEPSDICILFRRFTNYRVDLTAEYVRALEARRIPHVLVGSKSFHSREEVIAIRTALRAIEWPGDELSVFATIRGSLFAVMDATLLKFREQVGPLNPRRPMPEELDMEFAPVRDALALLLDLHRRRNYCPIADTINRLLEHCRAHAGFAFRQGGERVLANVLRLTDLSRQFEGLAATSFRSFVDYLEDQETSRESTDPSVLEQEGEGVRLMTVHHAKGLEFPVVILADLTAKLTSKQADRFVDPRRGLCAQSLLGMRPWELLDPANLAFEQRMNREEGERIAYVAATRARDLLVVSVIGERERPMLDETWLSPLHDALYPPHEQWRYANPPVGCQFKGSSTVMDKPLDLGMEETSVKPGMHEPVSGAHEVLWMDPAALGLEEPKFMGLRHEDLLSGSGEAGLQVYRQWEADRAEVIARGIHPRFAIERATEARTGDSNAVEVVRIEKAGVRPAGRSFGKLVHALLEQADLPVAEENLREIARVEARILGSPEGEVEPAIQTAIGALSHPLLRPAVGAVRVHREFPVMLRDGDRLIEGVIDLAFLVGEQWTIVDFKTGPADKKSNRGQLELYRKALAIATGLPVRAVLFEI